MENTTTEPVIKRRGWPKGKPRRPRRNTKELSCMLERIVEELRAVVPVARKQDAVLTAIRTIQKGE